MEIGEIQPLNQTVISNQDLSNLRLDVHPNFHSLTPQTSQLETYDKLNQLFTEQDQQKQSTIEAREILGVFANDLSNSQVYDLVNEIQYLVDSWLEEYERQVFGGKTLNELTGIDK